MSDSDRETPGRRDWQGRYETGHSGNPAGRPRGALNRATRIAAELLDGEAEALWRAEIDLALAAARAPAGRFNTDVSLDAKVTGGTISSGGEGGSSW